MPDQVLRDFGANVKKLRLARGWSQEELAQQADLHRTYIGSIERSERNVSLLNVARIAKAFGIPITALLDKRRDARKSKSGKTREIDVGR